MELKKTIYQVAKELNLKGREKAAFLATIHQETGGFKARKEKTFTAKNLKQFRDAKKFSKLKGMSDKEIDILVSKGPEAIFNKVYGDRKDLGNAPDEGYKYRGVGLFQHTGKHNISKLSKEIFPEAPNTLVDNPDLINNTEVMKKVAKNYWKKISSKVDFSKEDSMDRVTDIVNKKDIHRERRNELFKTYLPKSVAKKKISNESGYIITDQQLQEAKEKTKGKSYKQFAEEINKFKVQE